MWRILVFLTGGLGLFLVLILIIFIGFSNVSWQGIVCGGVGAFVGYLFYQAFNSDKVRRERRKRKAAKRREKQKRIQKAQMKKENAENP